MNSTDAIVRAIVHLNFNETDEALEVLLRALAELNYEKITKENSAHGRTESYAA